MPERATITVDPLPPRPTGLGFVGFLAGKFLILLAFVVCTTFLASVFVAAVALSDHLIVVPALHFVYADYENSSFHKSFIEFLEIFPLVIFVVHALIIVKMLNFLEEQMKTIFFEPSDER